MNKIQFNKIYKNGLNLLGSNLLNETELGVFNQLLHKMEIKPEEQRILDAFLIKNSDVEIDTLESLTPFQFRHELDNLYVLLKYNYSGFDYFNKDGSIDLLMNELRSYFSKITTSLNTLDFFNIVASKLNEVIKDNHIGIICNGKRVNMGINKIPYFTDVVLEKVDDRLIVVNDNDYFEKNYVVKGNVEKYLFKTLPINDNQRFLIGIFQDEKVNKQSLIFENKELPLHISRSAKVTFSKKNILNECSNHNLYMLNRCTPDQKVDYFDIGKKLSQKDYAIISVLGNPGGSSDVSSQLIRGLNGNGQWHCDGSVYNIFQKSRLPYKYFYTSFDELEKTPNSYDKNLYVLMNKGTASAGEALVSISNNVKNVIKIGTNTMGCGCFGDCIIYVFPQSHATIRLPYKVFYMDGFVEGEGFLPDYWLDDENIIPLVTGWIENGKRKN